MGCKGFATSTVVISNNQIDDEPDGPEEWTGEEYVDFDPADYVDNPVALAG